MNYADRGPHLIEAVSTAVGGTPAAAPDDQPLDPAEEGKVAQATASAGATFAPAPTPARASAAPAAAQPFVIRRVLPIKDPIAYGQWFWDDKDVPAGPILITVDLEARVVSVFRGGYEIGTAAVLLGTDEKPTPLGVFPILAKDAHHVSNLYDAPMPFTQRLTGDGVSLHATTVQNGYASHGCIGLPLGFARKLFATTHLGDKVYITRGKQVGVGADLTQS
ncbi:MAG: L,D-transpeptidase family protein [Proteobacteria bacterium]|nr:L,D-transpeptidase family protein [Pseudomonadota bacterium]